MCVCKGQINAVNPRMSTCSYFFAIDKPDLLQHEPCMPALLSVVHENVHLVKHDFMPLDTAGGKLMWTPERPNGEQCTFVHCRTD